MRKYKPQKFGLNPLWVEKYILKPFTVIIAAASIVTIVVIQYKTYAEERAEIEKQEAIAKSEQRAIEESIAESKRAKEEARIEEEKMKVSLAQVEVETRRTNALYENKITKKVIDGKKYWRNNKIKKVGKVDKIYGLEVVTNNDWSFMLDTNGNLPDEIVNIGYAEYARTLKRQKEREEKRNSIENANKIQQLIDAEMREQEKTIKDKLYIYKDNYHYIEIDNTKYKIIRIIGNDLIVLKKGDKEKKYNYKTMPYSDQMKPITYMNYELEK